MGVISHSVRAIARGAAPRPVLGTLVRTVGAEVTGSIHAAREHVARQIGGAALANALDGEVATRTAALSEELGRVRVYGELDQLTWLTNRRVGLEYLESSLASPNRTTGFAMFDADHFKSVNDTFGHATGDAVLQAKAGVLDRVARAHGGMAMRLGGEEFAIVVPDADVARMREVAEEVLAGVRSLEVSAPDGSTVKFTSSAGVTSTTGRNADDDGVAQVLDRADALLYEAKHAGRDRVVASR